MKNPFRQRESYGRLKNALNDLFSEKPKLSVTSFCTVKITFSSNLITVIFEFLIFNFDLINKKSLCHPQKFFSRQIIFLGREKH